MEQKLKQLLEDERWYPMGHCYPEYIVAENYNSFLDSLILFDHALETVHMYKMVLTRLEEKLRELSPDADLTATAPLLYWNYDKNKENNLARSISREDAQKARQEVQSQRIRHYPPLN